MKSSNAPLEVWIVAAGVLIVGVLLCYPMLRYGLPHLGDLIGGDKFTRAITALVFFILVLLAGTGIGLLSLAVGLIRGDRMAQVLTCILSGIVALSELITLSGNAPGAYGAAGNSEGASLAILLVSCLIIVLLTAPPTAREFFAADIDRPIGVLLAAATAVYLGAVIALEGLLLMVAGVAGAKFVWWGLLFTAAGAVLIACAHWLRASRNSARVVTSIAFGLVTVLMFVVISSGSGSGASFETLVPLGITLAALAALWLPVSSQSHFAYPRELTGLSPATKGGLAALGVLALILAIVGFVSSGSAGDSYAAGDTHLPAAGHSTQIKPLTAASSP